MALQTLVGASMKTKTFQFFKAGTHTTMAGESITFSVSDLRTAAQTYALSKGSAPLVVNHPQDDAPVMGTVRSLTEKNGVLYATAEFGEALVKKIKAKAFRGVSAKFFKPHDLRNPHPGTWWLRHIGFLDGINPAVKGLDEVSFSEYPLSGIHFDLVEEMEVAFSETPADSEDGTSRERNILHAFAQLLVKERGLKYADAAHIAHAEMEKYKARKKASAEMDPDRVAFHEAALDYQRVIPGVTYEAAARHILSQSAK